MISKFLQMQMDYIFFFYGLGFLLLAAATQVLSRSEKEQIPWKWLYLFGLAHGINEWLDMLVYSLKDSPSFALVRLIVLVISFLFLIEFGRAGSNAVSGRGPGRWVFLPLLTLAGLGAFEGMSGLNVSSRYALGLTGGMWAALALWKYRRAAHPGSRPLLIGTIAMGCYALATGLVVPQAPFYPAIILNHTSFFAFAGFPIQLLRGILACMAAAAVYQYYGALRRTAFRDVLSPAAFRYEGWTITAIAAVLAAGWIMTVYFGEFGQQLDEEQYRSELKLIQRTFEASVETADRLVQTMAASPNFRTVGLPGRRDLPAINSTLDRYARITSDSICYVLDSEGTTLASSNRNTPSSFVGHSYAIRPYFKKAIEGSQGSYVASGLTSKLPGYYSSFPLKDANGAVTGVAVVKLNLDKLFILHNNKDYGFLLDPNGVILSSTHPDFLLRTMWPIGDEARHRLKESQQFPGISDSPVLPTEIMPGTLFTFHGEVLQIFLQSTSVQGLSLVVFGSMNSLKMARLVGILITLLLTVLLLVFFVTQQRNSETSARIGASERLYRTLVEGSPNWVGLFDHGGRCAAINQNGLRAMGRTEAEFIGRHFSEIWGKETVFISEDPIKRVLSGEQVSFEVDYIRSDGPSMSWQIALNPVFEVDGTVTAFVGIADDITERKRAEEALRESEERYRLIFDHSPLGIMHFDSDGIIRDFNEKFAEIMGASRAKLMGFNMIERLKDPAMLEAVQHALDGELGQYEGDYTSVTGNKTCAMRAIYKRITSQDGNFLGAVGLFEDISERKSTEEERIRLEKQLQQAQKAESLGRMAASIAHHFNNMLGAVIGNLELSLDGLPAEGNAQRNIKEAIKATRRAAEVSRLMLVYLGQTAGQKEPLDFAQTLKETIPLLEASMPGKVHLNVELPSRGPIILGDSAHIKQVLANLVSNAAEAMDENEGEITVAIDVTTLTEIRGLRLFPLDWGPKDKVFACLSVADTGCGMDTATLERIFDPFFSTKFTGRGLGLSVALGLVRAHGGAIGVEITPGRGAVFRVFLPLHTTATSESIKEEPTDYRLPEGGDLVLVVDDEPMVRDMAKIMLEGKLGCWVAAASDGFEAVEIVRAHKDGIKLVLLDLNMPGMNGWETLAALRSIRPGIPVVLASGYNDTRAMEGDHAEQPLVFLDKPYRFEDLRAAVLKVQIKTTEYATGGRKSPD